MGYNLTNYLIPSTSTSNGTPCGGDYSTKVNSVKWICLPCLRWMEEKEDLKKVGDEVPGSKQNQHTDTQRDVCHVLLLGDLFL